MSLGDLREAVRLTARQSILEASGNVTLDSIRDIAMTGVDYVSVGALTHRLRRLDFGLDAS